jgi:hypothetical protein
MFLTVLVIPVVDWAEIYPLVHVVHGRQHGAVKTC